MSTTAHPSGDPLSLTYDPLAAHGPGDDLLSLRIAFAQGTFVIAVYGELDLSTVGELERQLRRAERTDATEIVVDLSATHFIDSTGISALVSAARRSPGRLAILRGGGEVDRAFEVCGLSDSLPFAD